jgi:hypothetical protein
MKVNIIDYVGLFEDGILVSVNINYDNAWYDGIFYYDENKMYLNIDDNLYDMIGDIEEHDEYLEIMEYIINNVESYEKIVKDLEQINNI